MTEPDPLEPGATLVCDAMPCGRAEMFVLAIPRIRWLRRRRPPRPRRAH